MSCLSLLFEVFLGNTEVEYLKYLYQVKNNLSNHQMKASSDTGLTKFSTTQFCFYNVSKLQVTNKSFFITQLDVLFANTTGVKTFITICVWLYKITAATGVIVL